MNILPIFLYIVSLSTFIGETKAKETCYYKTVEEYKGCLSSNPYNLRQSFPTYFGSSGGGEHEFVLWFECPNGRNDCLNTKKKYKAIRMFSEDGKNLEVRYGRLALWTGQQFKTRKTQNIPSQNIISWNKKDFRTNNWNFNLFSIKYVDDNYKLNDLFFLSESVFNYGGNTRIRVQQHTEYIEKFLIALTNLKESETNDDKNQKIINAAQREREIIGSIIGKTNLDSSCKKIDDTKFPELTEKYKNISYSINLLAKRLDLKRPINLKPICN